MPATELSTLVAWLNDPTRTIVAHLAKNFIPQDVESIQLTDLVECDFPGYAPIRIDDWAGVDFDEDTYAEAVSGELEWVASDAIVNPQAINVAYLTIQDGGPLHLFWPIPLPVSRTLAKEGDGFVFSFNVSSSNLDALSAVVTEV